MDKFTIWLQSYSIYLLIESELVQFYLLIAITFGHKLRDLVKLPLPHYFQGNFWLFKRHSI